MANGVPIAGIALRTSVLEKFGGSVRLSAFSLPKSRSTSAAAWSMSGSAARFSRRYASRYGSGSPLVRDWVQSEPRVDWVEPKGGVVCFPRIAAGADFDATAFHHNLLHKHGTYVGRGHWFEMPGTFIRLGYMWSTEGALRAGLEGISRALSD